MGSGLLFEKAFAQGRVYHSIGTLEERGQDTQGMPQVAHLHIIDPSQQQLEQRLAALAPHATSAGHTHSALRPRVLKQLQDFLLQHNQYVLQFRQVAATPPDKHYALLLGPQGQRDTRYMPVTATEVAGLLINSEHQRDANSLVRCSLAQHAPALHSTGRLCAACTALHYTAMPSCAHHCASLRNTTTPDLAIPTDALETTTNMS
jgi:hypothetical protein